MKTHHGIILGILLFIFCVHLSLLFVTRNSIVWSDAKQYDSYGWSIAQGNGYRTSYKPPAYPYFLGLVYWLFGHQPNVAKLAQIFLYLLLCYAVYLMGKLLFDERTANLSASIVGTYPSLVGFNLILMSDNLFTLLLTLSVLTSVYFFSTRKMKFLVASGVLAGLATLTRTVGVALLVSLIIVLGVESLRTRRVFVWPVLLSILGFLAVVLPWTYRNYYVHRSSVFVDTNLGINLYIGNARDTPIWGCWKKMESLGEDV
ncbi:MAG TPA: phospholipid carrier-dependent glycosyltransferase, partial [Anaerolineae bacterium]|nr:phospholipid carrier-dependent glycosyltransferase [Anaerolineae bacterium]